ncbi:MAG TPA: prepilin-type N-terminal cleavage/methylation domain-containing protein [Acidimicrobiales bacterium]|nr:prepilin-type N-terminal cleavage/methylation domain-containing protein [Acidimicrobiales bacterium]
MWRHDEPAGNRRISSPRRASRRPRDQSGYSLIEVMVALVLLLVTMIPLGYLVTNEVHQAASAKDSLAALGISEKWLEILGTAQDPPPRSGSLAVDTGRPLIPIRPDGTPLPNNGTESRGGTTFTVRAEYTWTGTQDINTAPNLCTSGGAQVLNLQVTVNWGLNQHITDTTVLDYPPPGIPQYGFYQLQVSGDTTANDLGGNAWSSRVQAIPVTFTPTGGTGVTIYPDQYGCVFAELNPGTYSVSVANPVAGSPLAGNTYGNPSFVQNLATDGTTAEPKGPFVSSATISAGVVTVATQLNYDEGSTVGLSYPTSTFAADGVTCPGVLQITCLSEGEGTTGSLGATPPKATLAYTSGSTWSSASTPASPTSTRIASVACVSIACIGVGYGLTGSTPHGVILSDNTTTPSAVTADTVPASVASLTDVICPTATACVAWGTLTTGLPVVLAGTISASGDTWSLVTLPNNPLLNQMSVLNQVSCSPGSGSAPPNCVAVGSGSGLLDLWGWAASGPLFGSGTSGGTWVAPLVPITGLGNPPNLTQVSCPSAGVCMAVGTGQILGVLGLGPVLPIAVSGLFNPIGPGAIAWTPDLFPLLPLLAPIPTTFTQLTCLSSNTCLLVGAGSKPFIYSATAGLVGPLFLTLDAVPASTASISQLSCPSVSTCVALGTATNGGPAILSGAIGAPDTWSAAGIIPATIGSVSAVACPNATTCAIAADNLAGNQTAAILSGTPGLATTWASATLPAVDAGTLYLTGISCTPTVSPATSTCSAVGASASGATIMMSTGGPAGPWNDRSADPGLAMTGSPTSSIPIELGTPGLKKTGGSLGFWNAVVGTTAAGTIIPLTTSIPTIFPFATGYGVAAGDCLTEYQAVSVGTGLASTVPGATSVTATTVPLAVLPIQVNSSAGAAESGDVVTLTATTSGCTGDKYTLQPTGPDGFSRTEVPFGTYSLSVTLPAGGASPTYPAVVVGAGTVSVGSTVYSLPHIPTVVGP